MTRTERTYYLLSGGYNLAQFFLAPLYPLFLLSRGLDLFQMNAVLATYMLTVFVLEVPTGAFADVAGRRRSFVLGCLLRATAFALYTRTRGFGDCLRAELVDAIGTACVSGALDAWAVDGMRAEGDRRPMDPVFARASVLTRVVMIAGSVAAGYLAEVDLAVPWLVAAGLFALVALVGGAVMREDERPRGTTSVTRTAIAGLALVRGSPVLSLLCLLTLAGAFAALPAYMLWQPRLRALGAGDFGALGWIVAAMHVAGLAGSALVPRVLRRVRREAVLAGTALWRAAMFLPLATSTTLAPAVMGLVLQEIGFGLSDPVATGWVNEHVAAGQRATVLSVRSTFLTLGAATGLLALGLVARHDGAPAAFAISAVLLVLVAPGYVVLGRVARRGAAPAPVSLAQPGHVRTGSAG
jgi:MFS family permease